MIKLLIASSREVWSVVAALALGAGLFLLPTLTHADGTYHMYPGEAFRINWDSFGVTNCEAQHGYPGNLPFGAQRPGWAPVSNTGFFDMPINLVNFYGNHDFVVRCQRVSNGNYVSDTSYSSVYPRPPVPNAPTCNATFDQATLSWNSVPNISTYRVRYDKLDFAEACASGWIVEPSDFMQCRRDFSGTSATLPTVPSRTYTWRVTAVTGALESALVSSGTLHDNRYSLPTTAANCTPPTVPVSMTFSVDNTSVVTPGGATWLRWQVNNIPARYTAAQGGSVSCLGRGGSFEGEGVGPAGSFYLYYTTPETSTYGLECIGFSGSTNEGEIIRANPLVTVVAADAPPPSSWCRLGAMEAFTDFCAGAPPYCVWFDIVRTSTGGHLYVQENNPACDTAAMCGQPVVYHNPVSSIPLCSATGPAVTFTINPTTVVAGSPVNMSWSVSGANTCTLSSSGAATWSYSVPDSNSSTSTTPVAVGDHILTFSCRNSTSGLSTNVSRSLRVNSAPPSCGPNGSFYQWNGINWDDYNSPSWSPNAFSPTYSMSNQGPVISGPTPLVGGVSNVVASAAPYPSRATILRCTAATTPPPPTCALGPEQSESGPTNMFAGTPPCQNVNDLAPFTSPNCPAGATTGTVVLLSQLSSGGTCATRQIQTSQCSGTAFYRSCAAAAPTINLNFR